jgi:hypothetical protein
MKEKFREYHTIRFFRGKKRDNAELKRLAEAELDFEYRRLLIKEYELDLHVEFSKRTVFCWLTWSSLVLAFCFWHCSIITAFFFGLALIACILTIIYRRRFQLTFWRYNFALCIVDAVIFNEYRIRLS